MKNIKMHLPQPQNEVQLRFFLNKLIEKLKYNHSLGMNYVDLNETIIMLETISELIGK